MLDILGTELSEDEIELLRHPNTGGVILFSRNYSNPSQLNDLTQQIRKIKTPPLLIGVDQEGGRVQRFRDQFTRLPPCRRFGEQYDENKSDALKNAESAGWLMAIELLSVGVDFSFAPVLDLDKGKSQVIGERAFHNDADVVAELAKRYVSGMRSAGMAAVGKHFPGHGHVKEDSHETIPVDSRLFQDLLMSDIIPFERLITSGIEGIMPAHVIYPQVDNNPAGFSAIWLEEILRKQLGFNGAIFSDDINMAGAEIAGSPLERAYAALNAGCDMVLVCNNQIASTEVLENLKIEARPVSKVRHMRMYGNNTKNVFSELKQNIRWVECVGKITSMDVSPELDLDDDEIRA